MTDNTTEKSIEENTQKAIDAATPPPMTITDSSCDYGTDTLHLNYEGVYDKLTLDKFLSGSYPSFLNGKITSITPPNEGLGHPYTNCGTVSIEKFPVRFRNEKGLDGFRTGG